MTPVPGTTGGTVECGADLGKDFPIALKRMIALKMGVIGGVAVFDTSSDDLDYLNANNVSASDLWVINLSDALMDRPEFEGLRGFAETFGDGHFRLYAFSDDFYNVTFVCQAGPNNLDLFGKDEDVLFSIFEGDRSITECRKSHEPLSSEAFLLPPRMEEYEGSEDAEALIDRQIEALWPAHIEHIMEAFWSFLRSPFDSLSSVISQEAIFTETAEARQSKERIEAINAVAFYRTADRTHQMFLNSRPQVR